MIHRHQLGKVPPKPHTTFYDNDKLLMEQCVTREGFNGPFSMLYFRKPPTDESQVEKMAVPGFAPFEIIEDQPLHRQHLRTGLEQPRRHSQAARAGAQVQDRRWRWPLLQHLDDYLRLRPGNQDLWRHGKIAAIEWGLADDVLERFAPHPPLNDGLEPGQLTGS